MVQWNHHNSIMSFPLFESPVNHKRKKIIMPKREKTSSGTLKIELRPRLGKKSSTESKRTLTCSKWASNSKILTKVNPKTIIAPIF